MLGKISSYPTYPIAVILKMAMHLEDPERTGFIGCDQEPPVKVAHEQSLVGNRVKALAGPFGRIGWMARRRLSADCGTTIR